MSTILVVDDMAIFRDPIAASLRLAGYLTLVAADGAEALALARAERPDLILLDVAMPRMDGLTFLKHLRADPDLRATRVILLTAVSEKPFVLKAASLGVGDYLLKSRFKLKDLLDRITRQLSAACVDAAGPPAASTAGAPSAAEAANAPPSAATTPAAASAGSGSGPGPAAAAVPGAASEPPARFAERGASREALPRLLTREACVARAASAFQAKTLSGVVMEVISLASSPRGDNAELAALIARDPMLSIRVIQAANAAAYTGGNARACATIPDAIRKVGCATVRNIAAALGVFDAMPETSADGFNPIRCWQHSFAVARICEHLASAARPGDPSRPGLAYLVGLCHDMAEIFIHGQFAAEYQQVLDVAERTRLPRGQVELEMMGMTHADLAHTIFRCIGMPDAIREPIEILHNPGAERSANPLARLLWMAEHYANGIMLAASPASPVAPLTQALCRSVTGEPHPAPPDAAALRSEVLCMTGMLARLPGGRSELLDAPFTRRPARVWLARDPLLSAFDPIGAALAALAEVDVRDRLPTGAELDGVQGCVVLARSGDGSALSADRVEELAARTAATDGRARPVLWISSAKVQPAGPNSPVPVQGPIALADLAAFVESLGESRRPARPVAA